jgi:hypothetical protein
MPAVPQASPPLLLVHIFKGVDTWMMCPLELTTTTREGVLCMSGGTCCSELDPSQSPHVGDNG